MDIAAAARITRNVTRRECNAISRERRCSWGKVKARARGETHSAAHTCHRISANSHAQSILKPHRSASHGSAPLVTVPRHRRPAHTEKKASCIQPNTHRTSPSLTPHPSPPPPPSPSPQTAIYHPVPSHPMPSTHRPRQQPAAITHYTRYTNTTVFHLSPRSRALCSHWPSTPIPALQGLLPSRSPNRPPDELEARAIASSRPLCTGTCGLAFFTTSGTYVGCGSGV